MMQTEEYIEVSIPVAGFDTDALSGRIHLSGSLGILEVDETRWTIYLPGDWREENIQHLLRDLQRLNSDFDFRKVQVARQPFQDWNSEWRKHFEPFEGVPGLWIRPPWQEVSLPATAEEIIIEPQMAFGTGHHETTRLMMQGMQELNVAGKNLLDLGTGSGILGIYARLLKAERIVGVDHDADAIDNARHNMALNKVQKIEFWVADVQQHDLAKFDIVLANINRQVLLDLVADFRKMLVPEGQLLISGILETDIPQITASFQNAGLKLLKQNILGEWAAMIWTPHDIGQGEIL